MAGWNRPDAIHCKLCGRVAGCPSFKGEWHSLEPGWFHKNSLSPCGRGLGRGVSCARDRSRAALPSSDASRHLLPQGEKETVFRTFCFKQVPSASRSSCTKEHCMAPPEKPHILIADDQRDVREALRLMLKGEGWNCTTVEGPAQALAAARTQPFDVALIDLNYT